MNTPINGITTGLKKNFGQDYNLFNRATPICHDKAINFLSRMFVREVMTCAILPILEEMPFNKS